MSAVLYFAFLILGTYAVPSLRISLADSNGGIPYPVPLFASLSVMVFLRVCLWGYRFRSALTVIGVSLYLVSIALSGLVAGHPDWTLSFKYAIFILGSFVISEAASKPDAALHSIRALCVTSIAVFFYGCYGYITEKVGDPMEHSFNYFGVTYIEATRNGDQLYLLVPFAILLGRLTARPRNIGKYEQLFSWALILLIGAGVLLSFSRSAWLSMTASAAMLCLVSRRQMSTSTISKIIAGFLILGGLAFWVMSGKSDLSEQMANRVTTLYRMADVQGGNSNSARLVLGRQVISTVLKNPFGVGVGNAQYSLRFPDGSAAKHAENAYLQILLEQGFLGLIGYLILIGSPMIYLFKRAQLRYSGFVDRAMLAVLVSFVVFGLFNNLNDNMWYWMIFGLVLAQGKMRRNRGVENLAIHYFPLPRHSHIQK